MKLEIEKKHVLAYLDGGLKAEMLDYKSDYVGRQFDEIIGIHQWSKNGDWCLLTDGGSKPALNAVKPILRSLSDLIKPITHNGETFVPIEKLFELKWLGYEYLEVFTEEIDGGVIVKAEYEMDKFYKLNIYTDFLYLLEHYLFVKLLDWKFDLFNLIPNNLAVPVTEDFNPYSEVKKSIERIIKLSEGNI